MNKSFLSNLFLIGIRKFKWGGGRRGQVVGDKHYILPLLLLVSVEW
jgi:hypothetical protein